MLTAAPGAAMSTPDDPAGSRAAQSTDGPGALRQHRALQAKEHNTAAPARAEGLCRHSERADQLIKRTGQLIERADQLIKSTGQLIERGDRLIAASSDRLSPRQAPASIGTGEVAGPAAGYGGEGTRVTGTPASAREPRHFHRYGWTVR
ncbi:hypothetical protein [Nonomuraea sp. NPDC050783]|uniref:hypothetical protein n=1 Tax=Nonomuraea sp. NPDC050783 TaxID=3154634 RepID=UPI0034678609